MNRSWETQKWKCVFNTDGYCFAFGEGLYSCSAAFCPLTEEALKNFISKSYQLQMWEIVQQKVKAWQSDILYDVQFIAKGGEQKQYLWLMRECGTYIFALPISSIENKNTLNSLIDMYKDELDVYILYPVKDVVLPIRIEALKKIKEA